MWFDTPGELPVATVLRGRATVTERALGALQGWLAARWTWLRPRTVPVLVALAGMVAVIQAVDYLAHPPADQLASRAPQPGAAPAPGFHVRVVLHE